MGVAQLFIGKRYFQFRVQIVKLVDYNSVNYKNRLSDVFMSKRPFTPNCHPWLQPSNISAISFTDFFVSTTKQIHLAGDIIKQKCSKI